jgi:LicD family
MLILRLMLDPNDYLSGDARWDGIEIGLTEVSDLSIDLKFNVQKYGRSLTGAEVACFNTHHRAWRIFAETEETVGLVIENGTSINVSYDEVEQATNGLSSTCDVCFPFDETTSIGSLSPVIGGFFSGKEWGSFAYFITQSGVERLLTIDTIRQPVDDEILSLSKSGSINCLMADTGWFSGRTWQKILTEREKSIRHAIGNTNVWTVQHKNSIRDLLGKLSDIGRELGISLLLDSGTLLGHVRHGSIMPWDDDVDLAILQDEWPSLLDALSRSGEIRISKLTWNVNGCTYYKVWLENGTAVYNKDYTFPFIDIWTFSVHGDGVIFSYGSNLPRSLIYPLLPVEFEGAAFLIPRHSLACLDILYSDWRTCIQIYPWSHRLEENHFVPLSMSISVDESGRIKA